MAGLKSLVKDTAIYGMSSIIGRFLNYLLVPIYVSAMSAKSGGYGVVTEVYAWTALLLVILVYGMETTFFRFVNKAEENPQRVYSTSLLMLGFTSGLFVLLCLVLFPVLHHILQHHLLLYSLYFEPEALLLETETADSKNWKHEILCQKEAARFYTHSTLFRLCGGLRMTMIWLLFLLSITALAISILTQHWEITAGIVILLGLWTGLRIREMKTAAQLFRIKTAGIYLPFYDLRLSCVYLANRIRYAFQDRKVFYRNMFH